LEQHFSVRPLFMHLSSAQALIGCFLLYFGIGLWLTVAV
jgi:hypothetical protein